MKSGFARLSRVVLAVFLTGAGLSVAHPVDPVDEYVKAEMKRQRVPGLALLVARDGKMLRADGYGLANVEHQVPVKPETVFQSGSMGKQFTATAVMMLVEEGKISLDDPITKHLKDAPPSWKGVTVRHLLSHTGGFTDYPESFNFRRDYTENELFNVIKTIPPAFPPGSKWSYSNLGYATLGILIHRVTGKFYGDFLKERIFRPLGMETTRVISEAEIIPNRAAGYRLVRDQLENQEWVAPTVNTTADGSLYFSILDLAKWDAALYTEKLLKASSLKQMWTPTSLNNGQSSHYGFGWSIEEVQGHHVIGHGGAWQGFKTHISRYADAKLTVVVLANLAEADPGSISEGVAALWLAQPSGSVDPGR
jgi:CubicO group peptidase (beta-lactamase class C family)